MYLCKLKEKIKNDSDDPFEQEIPIAFVRFPIVDECNLLRSGKYSLNLWPIPVFIDYYKGPKCCAYENLSFRYRGPTIDRHLKRFKKEMNANNKDNKDRELQNVFKLGIQCVTTTNVNQFNKTKIIALPLNHRCPYAKNRNCSIMDTMEEASSLINRDLLPRSENELFIYNSHEKEIIWKHRNNLRKLSNSFTAFLRCVDWRDPLQRSEAYDYMEKWKISASHTQNLEDLLELLSYEFMDTYVREYCVTRISEMPDNDLQIYLLQLVQCLKYELHHNNALIRLLMRRALSNPYRIGHFLFWHLKSEYLEKEELDQLHLDDITNHNVDKHIVKIIKICLNDKRRIMDNMIYAMVHQ